MAHLFCLVKYNSLCYINIWNKNYIYFSNLLIWGHWTKFQGNVFFNRTSLKKYNVCPIRGSRKRRFDFFVQRTYSCYIKLPVIWSDVHSSLRSNLIKSLKTERVSVCVGVCVFTFIRWVMIFTISSMEGRWDGSLDQQRVIRLSMGLGKFLIKGGLVPESKWERK